MQHFCPTLATIVTSKTHVNANMTVMEELFLEVKVKSLGHLVNIRTPALSPVVSDSCFGGV